MKKIISSLLALIMVVTILPAGIFNISAKAAQDGYYRYTVSNGKATITQVDTSISGDITIPDTLGGYPVTAIGKEAFDLCQNFTSITIPDSVTSIGDAAFRNCIGLTSITIPNGVKSIGDEAFYWCIGLTSIIIPDSVKSIGRSAFQFCRGLTSINIPDGVKSIGDWAFSDCRGITSITIGNGVTSIGSAAFKNCSKLTSIVIPNSVPSIGFSAFSRCSNLTSVTIPDSVTSLGDSAFYSCSSLTSITIPDSVTSIGDNAFYSCSGLTSITIPDSVTSLGDGAFSGCSGLTSITIPDSITAIDNRTFSGCSNLASITIPDSVTSIGFSAFSGCSGLTSITIPDSITSIGDSAFSRCSSLTAAYITNISSWCAIDFSNSSSNPLYFAKKLYLNGTLVTDLIIPNDTTSIGAFAFYDCSNLTSVIIPNSVTSIGARAFSGCSGLKSVTIPDSVTSIGDFAFSGCSRITLNIADSNSYAIKYAKGNIIKYTTVHIHNHKATGVISEPTCTEPGYAEVTCEGCGDTKTEEIAALGHTFVKNKTVPPTPTSQGYTVYSCKVCGETENKDFISFSVQNVIVTPTDIGFNVTWDAEEYADGYYVRIREKDGTTNLTNVNVKGTSYEFVIGKNGLSLDYDKEYTIQVIAQVGTAYQSFANATKVTSKMVIANRVVDVNTTEYRNGAQVTFRPVEGANKYWVYVRNAADNSAVYTTSTTTTTVNIVNNMVGGTEYYVQIVAFKDNTALDTRANALKTKFTTPYVLPSTYNIAAKTPTTFSITWDAVAGATTYFIQVRTEDDAPVRTITVNYKTIAHIMMYSDGTRLSPNTSYKFRIAATINGKTTEYGNWMTYTTGDYETVTVNAEKVDNKVKISWNNITNTGAVYLYKIDANGKRTYFYYIGNGETSYTIKAPASGSYRYGVVTVQRNMSGDCYNPIAVSNTLTF